MTVLSRELLSLGWCLWQVEQVEQVGQVLPSRFTQTQRQRRHTFPRGSQTLGRSDDAVSNRAAGVA